MSRQARARAFGLLVALAAGAAGVAALPPRCAPFPVEAVGPADDECTRRLCDPATGACAFVHRLPDGTPCAGGAGVCAAGRCGCPAACGERVCGPDGCGSSCGVCAAGEFCTAGTCVPEGVGPGPAPQLVESFPAAAQAIAVKGTTGYLGAGDHLFVLDLSDPERPRELARLVLPAAPRRGALLADPARPYLYVGLEDARGLGIVDVARPRAPRLVQTVLSGRSVRPLASHAKVLYATSSVRVSADPDVYETRFSVIAVDDPAAPRVETVPGIPAGRLAIRGAFGYVADGEGLTVLDLGAPDAPRVVALVPLEYEQRPSVLCVAGDHLIGAGQLDLVVFDLRDPARPRLRSATRVPGSPGDQADELAVVGDTLYAACRYAYESAGAGLGLRVFDLSDLDAPRFVQGVGQGCGHPWHDPFGCDAQDLAVTDTTAWLAYGPNGLQGWRRDAPDGLAARVGTFHMVGAPVSLTGHGDILVAASDRPGVTLLDGSGAVSRTASPAHLEIVGAFEVTGVQDDGVDDDRLRARVPRVHAAVVRDGRVYAGYDEALLVLGLDDPARPALLGSLAVPFTFDREGGFLAVGDGFVAYAPSYHVSGVGTQPRVVTLRRGDVLGDHPSFEWAPASRLPDGVAAGPELFLFDAPHLVRVDPAATPPARELLWEFGPDAGALRVSVTAAAFWFTDPYDRALRVLTRDGAGAPLVLHTIELSQEDHIGEQWRPTVAEPYAYVAYPVLGDEGAVDVVRRGHDGVPALVGTAAVPRAPRGTSVVLGRHLYVPHAGGVAVYGPAPE